MERIVSLCFWSQQEGLHFKRQSIKYFLTPKYHHNLENWKKQTSSKTEAYTPAFQHMKNKVRIYLQCNRAIAQNNNIDRALKRYDIQQKTF